MHLSKQVTQRNQVTEATGEHVSYYTSSYTVHAEGLYSGVIRSEDKAVSSGQHECVSGGNQLRLLQSNLN